MNEEQMLTLIQNHLARYDQMEVLDVYKLLHQSIFGPGHLIPNKKTAREQLELELSLIEPDAERALIESIHIEGAMVRLHLQPYLAHGAASNPLLDAFMRSAEQVQGSAEGMHHHWQMFETLCQPGANLAGLFPMREITLFGHRRAEENWPAVHHSPVYNHVYNPHYRVLTRAEVERLCSKTKLPVEVV